MASVFSRPLLASEHSEFDVGAEALAFELARRCAVPLGCVLPVVSNPEFEAAAPQIAAQVDAQASQRRERILARANAERIELNLRTRHGLEPFAEIVEEARDAAADLIIIRRRGKRGLFANLLLGEMVSKVISHAPCSVLIVPRDAKMWSRKVLLGVNPNAPDDAALDEAAGLAIEFGVPLLVVGVIGHEGERVQVDQVVRSAVERATALGCKAQGECRLGKAHKELVEAARASGADLIVVGRHGGEHLERAWIGGVTQKTIGLAQCPVLVHVATETPK